MSESRIVLPHGVSGSAGNGWERISSPHAPPNAHVFIHRGKSLSAIRSNDAGRWHLSVAHRDRVPTWGELGFARDTLLPADVWMMVPHPPRKYLLNINDRVLHLWEFQDAVLKEQFMFEGELAQRTGFGVPNDGGAIAEGGR
jgi:hypothetical protein